MRRIIAESEVPKQSQAEGAGKMNPCGTTAAKPLKAPSLIDALKQQRGLGPKQRLCKRANQPLFLSRLTTSFIVASFLKITNA